MISDQVKKHCHACEHWKGRCLKGRITSAKTGCPIKRFPPEGGAAYHPDKEAEVVDEKTCCGGEMPDLTVAQVAAQFAQAMLKWAKSGMRLATQEQHNARMGICNQCPQKRGYFCTRCRCICQIKTKLATSICPATPSRWKAL